MSAAHEAATSHFAPAGREPIGQVQRQASVIRSESLFRATLDALPDVVFILNRQRQIVGANKALFELFQLTNNDVLGKRMGEVLGCHTCAFGPDGCGTARECSTCGAVTAVLASWEEGRKVTRECRMRFEDPVGALDLRVCATAAALGGEEFTICVLTDISDQKRLALLSHLFFHDVVNTVGSIQGFARLLERSNRNEQLPRRDLAQLVRLADQLTEEVRAHRDLTYAESGDLMPEFDPVNSRDLLRRLRSNYAGHAVGRDREIDLVDVWNGNFVTDHRLLSRVLGNMLKNALEATEPGGRVTVSCCEDGSEVVFRVHNPSVMPEDVQLQVFHRSFSTKGTPGRGIGTHSMKLLGERYLGGRVRFTSREPEGTIFSLALPKTPRDSDEYAVPRTAK